MTKVNLAHRKELQEIWQELQGLSIRVFNAVHADGPFCDKCGETHPESSFYPMWTSMGISGWHCNECHGEHESDPGRGR